MKPSFKITLTSFMNEVNSLLTMLLLICVCPNLTQAQTIIDVHTANANVIVVVLETDPPNRDVIPVSTGWTVNGIDPTSIGRSSEVSDERWYDWTVGYYETFVQHRMYLELSQNLVNNAIYDIVTPYGSTSFTFNDTDIFCESIKVNQEGYSDEATSNYANFGYYGGTLGSAQLIQPTNFHVVNEQDNATIASGTLSYWGDDTGIALETSGEYVYRIDLSTVPTGGPYHIVVEGIGKSYAFGVGDNYIREVARVHARGMYHQRCGMALEQPHTAYERGVCHEETAFVMEPWGASTFITVPSDTEMHPVIGGYHDAGDYDRRPQHTIIPITMLSTYEAFPEHFIDGQYDIPESGNGIPDFLDEALWAVLLWENLQLNADNSDNIDHHGGVMQGTETSAHPTYGVHRADYEGGLIYGTFEVGMKVTMDAAGIFAQASRLIQPYNPSKAAELLQKANLAWTYITNNYVDGTHRGAMIYASLQMYLATATGDAAQDANNIYHIQFRDNAIFSIINEGIWPNQYLGGNMSALIKSSHFVSYLLTNHNTDATVKDGIFNALKLEADTGGYMEWNELDYPYAQGVTKFNAWGASTAQGRYTEDLAYMMRLSEDEADRQNYFNSISNLSNYSLGLNPQGQSYVTGLGDNQPVSPLHADSYFTKYGVLPGGGIQTAIGNVPGIVIYGSTENRSGAGYQTAVTDKLYPVWDDLPGLRRWSDGWSAVNQNEFTTWETMVWNTCMFGVLYDASQDDNTLAVDDMETDANNLVLYPNPSNGTIHLEANNLKGSIIELFDLNGRKMHQIEAMQNMFNFNVSLASGMYLAKISKDGKSQIKKIIMK